MWLKYTLLELWRSGSASKLCLCFFSCVQFQFIVYLCTKCICLHWSELRNPARKSCWCHNPRDYTEDFNTFVAIGLTYLSPWSHCWGWSRTLCSYADSPPWLWCLRRGSYNQGTLRSSGTSSHCCGTVARPLNYMPRNWGPPPQNDSAETQEAHPVDLCVWEERDKSVYCHVILCELNWNLIPRPDKRFCKLHSTVFLLLGW